MALSNMKVFSQYIKHATIETLAQLVNKFNAASNGAIRLTTQGVDGDFLQESIWKGLHAAQRRVDRYAANGDQSATALAQLQQNSIKIAGGFGPILWEPAQLTWIEKDPAEALEVISRNLAEAIVADQLNTSVAALVAAISNVAAATNDVSGTAGITYSAINSAHAKFGDASNSLVAQVMTGEVFHKLIGQNLTNAQHLFNSQSVNVIDILGRPVIVTDAPALYSAAVTDPAAPAKQRVLSLADSAAIVHDGSDIVTNVESSNGKDRIETTFQADYTFALGLKGYAWDIANGGKSPTDAEIATGSNWDQFVTSVKHTAGVITIGDASK
ncbi:MAG TPA: major capsid protein [Burkholderiaceae bacterium]|nr:major capsid protein [Burkholderiaceae bacterium]